MADPRLIVALDYPGEAQALALADRLEPELCRLKVGQELFSRAGPALVEQLRRRGFDIFLDLKYHDIPNTVAGAVRAAADLGVWMVNVHAAGGRRMLEAARRALDGGEGAPLLVAVTVLTSLAEADLAELGSAETPEQQVMRLAALAADAGLDGVVCSAREARPLRERWGEGFVLVTPGVRLAEDDPGDQRRVVTPAEAVAMGSDYLVMGRGITGAQDPLATLRAVASELAQRS